MNTHPTMMEIERVLIEEAQTDAVGLWAVLWEVMQVMPALTPDEARDTTLAVVRGALSGDAIVAGSFVDHDEDTAAFVPWGLPVDEAVSRIEREWRGLGREPTLGDVVCFIGRRLLPVSLRKHPMGKGWKP